MGFFNRQEAKWKARMVMRNAYPHPMLVTLVYLLLTAGITSAVMFFISDPFELAYRYMMSGQYETLDVIRYVFTARRTGLYALVQLLLTLYGWIIKFGYTSYSLRLARGEQPNYRNLLDGFAVMGKVLAVGLLMSLFLSLWSMLAVIPYAILFVAAIVTESAALLALALLALFAAVAVVVIVTLRYQLAEYFLLDNLDMGPLEAIRHSKEAMKGWKGSAFLLELSFLGWALLSPFTFGILTLWLVPYQSASFANFYDHVVHGSFGPRTDEPGQPGGYNSNYGGGPRNSSSF